MQAIDFIEGILLSIGEFEPHDNVYCRDPL